ncbi:MAG: hypothetical protein K9G76_05975 [Bacteroidales bacterium]|nr:hypothetical protein [Bacteroidales bacterium]MCF8402424.1 hypothetical protein [Bacteroidales bacterium]
MKKITTTGIFLLLMAISVLGQMDQDGAIVTKKDGTNKGIMTQVFAEDVIVQGSLAVGLDATSGEVFGFHTIRLKENNLRIGFEDTSNSGSFPTNDWEIAINGADNGGQDYFRINDVSGGKSPFSLIAGAPSHSLYVDAQGDVGLGTDAPVVELHVKDGDTPTMRLEQDGSSGFTPQTWDVAGNETNFFVRDISNGSLIPFKIKPGCPTGSLFLAANGNVGLGTENPEHKLEVAGDAQVNNYFYFGDESTDGNWRVSVVAGKLTFEKREGGVFVTKIEME